MPQHYEVAAAAYMHEHLRLLNLRPSRSVRLRIANRITTIRANAGIVGPSIEAIGSQSRSSGAFPLSSSRSARMPLRHRMDVHY
jgi:hypothetical protein